PHESLSGLARYFADGLKNQAIDQGLKQVPSDFYRSLTETSSAKETPRSGDLAPGEVLNLSNLKGGEDGEKKRESRNNLAGIDYRREVVQGSEMRQNRQMSELDRKVNEIMVELQRLVKSSTTLSNEYSRLAVDQKPVAVGK